MVVWNNCAPPKVKFFGWLTWQGKVKTSSFLRRIGILAAFANVGCVFCQNEKEPVNHILLSCPFVWLLWSKIMKWWGFQRVMPNLVEGLLQWWSFYKMKKTEKLLWMVVPLAVLWSTWKHRNDCVFNGSQPNFEELCEVVKARIALWAQSFLTKLEFSINDIVFNLPQAAVGVLAAARCLVIGCLAMGLFVVQLMGLIVVQQKCLGHNLVMQQQPVVA
ncbi:uncharacterized protein LOC114321151 [Camellia sinensis]|uniref:uncharacterized protein LOC114321151 n=1 Tax=Camellia sinensis TaxID=4442 RepID=UPI00103683BC|nr:uncharacterized protein LOC114321151 [Camellia sinensis]